MKGLMEAEILFKVLVAHTYYPSTQEMEAAGPVQPSQLLCTRATGSVLSSFPHCP